MENYLDFLGAPEDLQAFFHLRLTPGWTGRTSTDVTCMLRLLMTRAGVTSLGKLEDLLSQQPAGARFNGCLKEYFNSGASLRRRGSKLMRVSSLRRLELQRQKRKHANFSVNELADANRDGEGAQALVKAASEAGILSQPEAGRFLLSLDREEMLGQLTNIWKSKKWSLDTDDNPFTDERWADVWGTARIVATDIWNRRSNWHKNAVRFVIAGPADRDAEFAVQHRGDLDGHLGPASCSAGAVEAKATAEYQIGMVLKGGTAVVRTMLTAEDLDDNRPRSDAVAA